MDVDEELRRFIHHTDDGSEIAGQYHEVIENDTNISLKVWWYRSSYPPLVLDYFWANDFYFEEVIKSGERTYPHTWPVGSRHHVCVRSARKRKSARCMQGLSPNNISRGATSIIKASEILTVDIRDHMYKTSYSEQEIDELLRPTDVKELPPSIRGFHDENYVPAPSRARWLASFSISDEHLIPYHCFVAAFIFASLSRMALRRFRKSMWELQEAMLHI